VPQVATTMTKAPIGRGRAVAARLREELVLRGHLKVHLLCQLGEVNPMAPADGRNVREVRLVVEGDDGTYERLVDDGDV